MLDSVDESLERFVRSAVPLSARNTDVSFEAPDRQWAAKLNNRPTVNLFLWDIKPSSDRARSGVETFQRDGQARRRMVLPRIELRYLISTWTTEHADSRVLMSGLLRVLLGHSVIPDEYLADTLRDLSPLTISMTRGGEAGIDVFKALDGQLKPTLDVVIVAEVDTELDEPSAAPAEEFSFVLSDARSGAGGPVRRTTMRRVAGQVNAPDASGCVVVSPRGRATVSAKGQFLISAEAGDELTVDTAPPLTATVPDHGGVVIG